MRGTHRLLGATIVALLAAPAFAHETLHEIRRDQAVAVKVFFVDGEVLAYTPYEVYSPADPKIPYQKGRTDREGWVAFVPKGAGKWRLKVVDDTGHGLDLEIDAARPAAANGGAVSNAVFVFRPVVGLLVMGAVFAALFLFYRDKKATA